MATARGIVSDIFTVALAKKNNNAIEIKRMLDREMSTINTVVQLFDVFCKTLTKIPMTRPSPA